MTSERGDVDRTMNFINVVKYNKNVNQFSNRPVGNEEDRNIGESFKNEMRREMEMRFKLLKKGSIDEELLKLQRE